MDAVSNDGQKPLISTSLGIGWKKYIFPTMPDCERFGVGAHYFLSRHIETAFELDRIDWHSNDPLCRLLTLASPTQAQKFLRYFGATLLGSEIRSTLEGKLVALYRHRLGADVHHFVVNQALLICPKVTLHGIENVSDIDERCDAAGLAALCALCDSFGEGFVRRMRLKLPRALSSTHPLVFSTPDRGTLRRIALRVWQVMNAEVFRRASWGHN